MTKAGASIEAYLYSLLLGKLNTMVISINYAHASSGIKHQMKEMEFLMFLYKLKLSTYYRKFSPQKFHISFSRPLSLNILTLLRYLIG